MTGKIPDDFSRLHHRNGVHLEVEVGHVNDRKEADRGTRSLPRPEAAPHPLSVP